MWICVCNSIRERDMREAITTKQLTDADDVYDAFDCQPKCGKCRPTICRLIDEEFIAKSVKK